MYDESNKRRDASRCKENVTHYIGNWPQDPVSCSRPASKDGYCKQHHPDAVKARQAAAQAKFDAKVAARLKPYSRIEQLECAVAELREALISCVEEMDQAISDRDMHLAFIEAYNDACEFLARLDGDNHV